MEKTYCTNCGAELHQTDTRDPTNLPNQLKIMLALLLLITIAWTGTFLLFFSSAGHVAQDQLPEIYWIFGALILFYITTIAVLILITKGIFEGSKWGKYGTSILSGVGTFILAITSRSDFFSTAGIRIAMFVASVYVFYGTLFDENVKAHFRTIHEDS